VLLFLTSKGWERHTLIVTKPNSPQTKICGLFDSYAGDSF